MFLLNDKKDTLIAADILTPVNTQIKPYFLDEAIGSRQEANYHDCTKPEDIKQAIEYTQLIGLEHSSVMPVIRYDEDNYEYRRVYDNEPEFTDVQHNLMLVVPMYDGVNVARADISDACDQMSQQTLQVRMLTLNLKTDKIETKTVDYQHAGFFDPKSNLHALLPGNQHWNLITYCNIPSDISQKFIEPATHMALNNAKKDPRTTNGAFYLSGANQMDAYSMFDIGAELYQYPETGIIDEMDYKVGKITGIEAKLNGWTDREHSKKIAMDVIKETDLNPVEHEYGFDDAIRAEKHAAGSGFFD